MSKFLLSPHPKQQTPAMSPSHPHTVGAAAAITLARYEDEDNDICPVCDGECTCANKPRTVHTTSTSSSSMPPGPIASSSTAPPVVMPKLPSLKIRLTIPPSMLGKRRASFGNSKSVKPTTSASAVDGGSFTAAPRPSTSFSSQYGSVPKQKGRPPKPVPSRQLGIKSGNDALSFYHPSQAPRRRKPTASKKTGIPRMPAKLKGKVTTVKKSSASKRKRVESSESSSELSDVDTFHFNDDHDDARSVQFPTFVSASALSSSSESDIVSLSGFDSDSSMEAEEENFIVAEESRAEKSRVRRELLGEDGQKRRIPHNNWVIRPRKRSVGPSDAEMEIDSDATEDDDEEEEQETEEDDEDETDGMPVGSGYIGVATGWSEPEDDQESSFDADLFFANLTDSEEDDEHSCPPDEIDERGEDGDQSDLDSMSVSNATLAGLILRRDLENLPFELTEGWDGQVIFSNGLGEGRGLLEVDFELHPSLVETSASPSQDSENDDMDTDEDGGFDGGDTTDEELIGEDHLPNERAMRLFNLPFSVSSINPMSTMSPSASPAPRNRRPFGMQTSVDSPKPADILSGRVFLEDSDNPDEFDDDVNAQSVSSGGNGPRTGSFIPGDTLRAVIDDTHASVPSPHPRIKGRGRGRTASHFSQTSPRHPHPSRTLSLPPLSQPSFHLLSSSELTTSPELSAQTIDLDDVLNSAFLDLEPSDDQLSTSPTEQSRKHLNLSRWGWGSDTPGSTDFGNVMRNSPLSSMLWQDKDVASSSRHPQSNLPPRAHDGDRTPTNAMAHTGAPPQKEVPTKSRKESRRERKVKQKNMGLGYERPPHQQHYFRQHHPNSKTRSSGSSQRSNFFNSSPPTTNL
ncbi:hypothetical protein B0H17DRAFT_1329754 [Mycena rosella]|uniref:Uncharacterized protein n=1 Tax=Mycena rosella TaxID=1033263 RepID=A0AAD7GMT6_MYCRO|nr:hypothetical protein B0H17DRAFT_1329754 [Mycena rosella]